MSEIKNNSNKPLPIDNCSMNQSDTEQIERPSLLCLNDDVLLHMFSYLDLTSSINLADTCVQLHNLSCWEFKKYFEFDTDKYSNEGSLPLEKILNSIAPHVQVLKTGLSQLSNYDMNACVNVKSLQVGGRLNDYLDVLRINRWISQLHLECLWFRRFSNTKTFYELFNGVTNLKELCIDDKSIDCREFVSRNSNIERLSLNVQHNFNFEIYSILHHLKSLHIRLPGTEYLNDMTRFGNFNGLTEFSFTCDGRWNVGEVNTFLIYLVEKTMLDKLRVYGGIINENTFTTLKLMNLSALSLYCSYDRYVFSNFILEYSAPQLKHLKLRGCSMEHVKNMVENWKNLETICVFLKRLDFVNKFLDETFIAEILTLSTDRPMLRLHVDSDHFCPCHIEICFKSQTFTKSYGIKKCFVSTTFGFSGNGLDSGCIYGIGCFGA